MPKKQNTYGDFIDSVSKTECIEAQLFIDEWKALATEEEWQEYRPMLLTPELVTNFAEDMAKYFRDTIATTDVEELYEMRKLWGHAFLAEVWAKAANLGVKVELNQIDAPLSASEFFAAAGIVKFAPSPKGGTIVRLTEKGERLAEEVQNEIEGEGESFTE